MPDTNHQHLSLRGIPQSTPPTSERYFYFDPQGYYRASAGQMDYEIEGVCLSIEGKIEQKIFPDPKELKGIVLGTPHQLRIAGLNSESPIGKVQFEQILAQSSNKNARKLLYLDDCSKLVRSIQECTSEVYAMQGEFYRILNCEQFFYPADAIEKGYTGVHFTRSPVTVKLWASYSFIIIRLHSLLDFVTKLAFETGKLRSTFNSYPKLSSANRKFGDAKNLKNIDCEGTVFEPSEIIRKVETLRNHIIHDGLLDELPKGYERYENGDVVERFVLLPDMEKGIFTKFGNRQFFYMHESKLNLQLPFFLEEFFSLYFRTLKNINKTLSSD